MPLSHKYELVMVHIPKNAGTSLKTSLDVVKPGHFPWSHYAHRYSKEWESYKSFAVLRDPIDRFVSCYNYARMEKSMYHNIDASDKKRGKHGDYDICSSMDINDIIEPWMNNEITLVHQGWSPQYRWINDGAKIAVDYLVHFNKIAEAMKELAPGAEVEILNKSTKTSAREQLTDKSIGLLSDIFYSDINLYEQMENNALCKV